MRSGRSLPALAAVFLLTSGTSEPPGLVSQPVVELSPADFGGKSWPLTSRHPGGITGDSTSFWVLDSVAMVISHVARRDGRLLDTIAIREVKAPLGIAFDGQHLWVADNATRRLHCLALNGNELRAVTVAIPLSEDHGQIKDLSWDGKYLWTAVAAGFASSFNQVDPVSGRVVCSLYANCNPVGIAVRNEVLWRLCDNGPGRRRTLSKVLLDEPLRARSVVPLGAVEDVLGAGLFFDGATLWTLDVDGPRSLASPAGQPIR